MRFVWGGREVLCSWEMERAPGQQARESESGSPCTA